VGRDLSVFGESFRKPGPANRGRTGQLPRFQLSSKPRGPFHGL
jgi:hypothetical protein